MKHIRRLAGILMFLLMITLATMYAQKTQQVSETRQQLEEQVLTAQTEYTVAKLKVKTRHLERNDAAWFYGIIASVGTVMFGYLFLIHRKTLPEKKTAGIVYAQIGKHSKIPVDAKHVREFEPIAVNLSLAEIESSISEGTRQTSEIYMQAVKDTLSYTKHLGRTITGAAGPDALPGQPVGMLTAGTPTFADLLRTGEIAVDKPMVIGYVNGLAVNATWKDLFSSAVGGQSGSGKTSTLRSLIAQSALHDVFFWLCDPHFPHEQSLASSLGSLTTTPCIRLATDKEQVEQIIAEVNTTIDRRLANQEPGDQAKVLAIDELSFLMDTSLRKPLEHTIKRIGKEGRKVQVYGLFSSQSWLADEIGTSARDNLTSIIAHHLKRNQANALLQDTDYTRQAKKLHTGQILFCPVNKDAQVLDVPFCTRQDMEVVAQKVGNPTQPLTISSQNASENARSGMLTQQEGVLISSEHQPTSEKSVHPLTPDMLCQLLDTTQVTQRELERQTGVNQSKISKLKHGNLDAMSHAEKDLIFDVLSSSDSPKPEEETAGNQDGLVLALAGNQLIQ